MNAGPAWMQADWGNLVMVSWLVDASWVQDRLPAGCSADLWEGSAAVSLVGVEFSNVVVKGISWPWHDRFPEVNLRTYVQGPNGPGVVFLGELVPKFMVARLARSTYGEPYEKRKVRMDRRVRHSEPEAAYEWEVGARTFRILVRAEAGSHPVPAGTLEEFLLSRNRGYNSFRGGTTYEVHHEPWTIRLPLRYAVDCATGAPFGSAFGPIFQSECSSVLFSDGSAVRVGFPRRTGT